MTEDIESVQKEIKREKEFVEEFKKVFDRYNIEEYILIIKEV